MKKKLFRLFRNKYAAAVIIFMVWITLFNDIDLFYIIRSRMELADMRQELEEIRVKNAESHQKLHDLSTNIATLEKFARENYYMRRKNEDIYVFQVKD